MASFIQNASRVTDIRKFLADVSGGNSIKYVAEKGTRQHLYIPKIEVSTVDESGNTTTMSSVCAISGMFHEWKDASGRFKSTLCIKDTVRHDDAGNLLNDGSCPICDRMDDAWSIYKYRNELLESRVPATIVGKDREDYLKKIHGSLADEMKAKKSKPYVYMLVVQFKCNTNGEPVMVNGIPEYALKVMKLSNKRLEDIQKQLSNSGMELAGSELVIDIPAVEDRRLQVSQSTTSPIFQGASFTYLYPKVLESINEAVAKFDFNSINKAFPEWDGMSTSAMKALMDSSFKCWDDYQSQLKVDPTAVYMEYISDVPSTNPDLNGAPALGGAPQIPQIPQIPAMGAEAAPAMPGMPGAQPVGIPQMPPMPQMPQMPGAQPAAQPAGAAEVNNQFAGAGLQI